jgi:hypothetical protein
VTAPDRAEFDGLAVVTGVSAAVVLGVCVVVSYVHGHDVAFRATANEYLSWGIPAGVDGLGLAGSARLVSDRRAGRRPLGSAYVAAGFGVLASLGANIVAVNPELVSDLTVKLAVAVYPPVGALLVGHLALHALGQRAPAADTAPEPAAVVPAPDPEPPRAPVAPAAPERAAEDRGWTRAPAPGSALPETRALERGPDARPGHERGPARAQDAPRQDAAPAPNARVVSPGPATDAAADLDPALVARAERVADALQLDGRPLSERALVAGLKADSTGTGVGRPVAKALLAHLDTRSHASTNGKVPVP